MIGDCIGFLWRHYQDRKTKKMLKGQCIKAAIGYLKQERVHKLQMGTGPNKLEGWFNTDLFPRSEGIYHLDASEPLPFDDGVFDYIFSEHLIEHLTYDDAIMMLKECFRVLKVGGRIRIITPDIDRIISLRSPDKTELQRRYISWHMESFFPSISKDKEVFVINNAFSGFGHRFLYDYETLRESLHRAGFDDVERMPYGHSNDENLRGIDWRARDEMTSYTGLCVEARRV